MTDEHFSKSEIKGETSWQTELWPKTEYCCPIYADDDWSPMYNGPDFMGCLKTPTLNTSWLEVQEPTATLAGRAEENFDRELSIDLLKEDYQRSINMLSPPPSPLFQNSPSPVEDNFSDLQSTFSQPISQLRSIAGKYNCIELRE